MPRTVTIAIPKIAEIRKAIAAGIATDAPLLFADITGNHWSQGDILALAAAFLGAALLVFGVPNADTKAAAKVVEEVVAAIDPAAAPIVNEMAQAIESPPAPQV